MLLWKLTVRIVEAAAFVVCIATATNAQDAVPAAKDYNQLQLQNVNRPQAAAAGPVFTPWARVTALQAGWVIDRMLVFLDTPVLSNPDNCPLVTNGYVINETDAGRNVFYAMLITALASGKEVALVVSGCFVDRPRAISVAIR
jgi:hypothetical protein